MQAQRQSGATDTPMKVAIAMILTCGLLVGQRVRAEAPSSPPPQHWVIVATIVDRISGKPHTEDRVGGPELAFVDAEQCQSMLNRLRQVDTVLADAVLTCRKVPEGATDHP
jgi:hypothetical protein